MINAKQSRIFVDLSLIKPFQLDSIYFAKMNKAKFYGTRNTCKGQEEE